ncbi:SusC/RagA family TonB-linked outer membrane protein [Parafilimonas sp.]|uniref:SusC/RagA family TonB-linked outer membrane protein n=1 Tax=Parafilimonas sp. TaxID=1969739 RepID=UPI0039E5DE27
MHTQCFAAGRTYLLIPLFLLSFLTAHAGGHYWQQLTVSGKITDSATGRPIASASVRVRGKSNGVTTAADGSYSISAGADDALIFSCVGYKDVTVEVGAQTTINVVMATASSTLQDVVVTALGVTKARRSVGYSVTEVKGASLTEARENSFINALEGKVAGVNISGVAAGPNSATNVVIRGFTSLTGDNQPLYVVNGVPLINNNYATTDVEGGWGGKDGGDGIGDINPDDIESISILKGAAATALYGYRGEKGVVLITTKKGKAGNGSGVEINSNEVIESVIDYTDFQTVYGQGYNGAKPVDALDALGSMESSWGAKLDGSLTPQFDGVSRPYSAVAKGNLKRFYKNGNTVTNTVSFSKGFGEAGSTRFSVSRMDNSSYVPNAGLQRMTFTQTTSLNPDKHLAFDLSSQYITEYTKNAPNLADAVGNLNWGPMFLPPNINIKTLAGANGDGTDADGYELNPFSDVYTTNPYFAAYKFIGAIHRNRFIGSANLKYTFDNGLFFSAQVADDYINDRNTNVEPIGTGYLVDNDINGDMTEQAVKQTELNIDVTGGKKFSITKNIELNVLVGGNYRKSQEEYITTYGQDFNIPFLYIISNTANVTAGYALYHSAYWSAYSSADLSYKNYAYLTITGRNDWYSTLAPGKTNYLYPSVSGSFVFSELWHIPKMNFGKIRLSYADVGGEATGAYQTLQGYGNSGTLEIDNGVYPIGFAGSSQVPNSGLIPSSRKEFEIGAELDFFQNRLKLDVAAYQKKVTNDIVPVSIDLTSGYTSALLNVGNLRYNGLELTLGGTPVNGHRFSWDIDFNASYTTGKVLYLGGQDYIGLGAAADDWGSAAAIRQVVGKAPNQIFANYPETDDKGKIVIDEDYDAPDPDAADLKDYGAAISPWTGGITNTFKYQHFSLTFLVDGKFGGKLFSTTNLVAYTQGLSKLTVAGRDKTYGTEDDAPSQYYGNWAYADQGLFVYDASFIKLRQIILGYDFPAAMFHNKIQGIRLSFVMRNVLTLLKHTPNIDPETSYSASIYSQGLEAPAVPYSRTFGLNLNVKF